MSDIANVATFLPQTWLEKLPGPQLMLRQEQQRASTTKSWRHRLEKLPQHKKFSIKIQNIGTDCRIFFSFETLIVNG